MNGKKVKAMLLKRGVAALLRVLARKGLIKEHGARICIGDDVIERFPRPRIKTDTMEFNVILTLRTTFYEWKRRFSTKGGKHLFTVVEDTCHDKRLVLSADLASFLIDGQWVKPQPKTFVYKCLGSPVPVSCAQLPSGDGGFKAVVINRRENSYSMVRDFTHEPKELLFEVVAAFYNEFKAYLQEQTLATSATSINSWE